MYHLHGAVVEGHLGTSGLNSAAAYLFLHLVLGLLPERPDVGTPDVVQGEPVNLTGQ